MLPKSGCLKKIEGQTFSDERHNIRSLAWSNPSPAKLSNASVHLRAGCHGERPSLECCFQVRISLERLISTSAFDKCSPNLASRAVGKKLRLYGQTCAWNLTILRHCRDASVETCEKQTATFAYEWCAVYSPSPPSKPKWHIHTTPNPARTIAQSPPRVKKTLKRKEGSRRGSSESST